MSSTRKPLRTLLAAALALAAAPALAQDSPFSQTVFFGDSLTDSGHFRPVLIQVVGSLAVAALVAEATMGSLLVGYASLVGGAAACSAAVWATGDWTVPLLAVGGQAALVAACLAPRLRAAWAR